jgi:hypothetical protein
MSDEPKIIVASENGISIRSFADISDAIGASLGAKGIIFAESDLSNEFFDLRTRLAGELFQKFTNYRVRVAFILPDPTAYGERFSELVYEHRTHAMIRFVSSLDEAKRWLAS